VATCSSSDLFMYLEVKSTELGVFIQDGVEILFQVSVIVSDLKAGSVAYIHNNQPFIVNNNVYDKR
jgi:hypothetical protein